MEFVARDGDGPVCLGFTAGCETREEFGVEERNPAGLGGSAPVEEREKDASGVIDAGVLDFVSLEII